MSKTETIKARLSDGTLRDFHVKISQDEPWKLEFEDLDGTVHCFQAADLFEALRAMRKDLESTGCQLLCAGARPDVSPSGMSRSMSGGRKAYIVHRESPASRTDMVDIFDYAEPAVVGTVQKQQEYFEDWTRSLRQRQTVTIVRPLPGETQEAKRHPNGWVYRIAGQFGPDDGVPPEAIVGAWKVDAHGEIIGEFLPNEKYDSVRWPSRRSNE